MTNNEIFQPDTAYEKSIHFYGRITIMTCMILALAVPLLLFFYTGIFPPGRALISGLITVSSFMIPLSLAEILAFYPILGAGGLYLSYTTGNISNMKLPCAAIAQDATGTPPNTPEGEIIGSIAMAGSVIVSEIILAAGMILIVPLSAYLKTPTLQPAFEQILPALFGALGAYFILKDYKLAIIPMTLGLACSLARIPSGAAVPLCVFLSILGTRIIFKKGWLKKI